MHPTERPLAIGPRIKFLNHAFNRKFLEITRSAGSDDFSLMHNRILGFLYCHQQKDIFQRDLEAAFHITRSSVAGIVKHMEEKGHIQRQSVPQDARLKKLTLTPLGRQICEQAMDAFEVVEAAAVRGLSPEQIKTFLSLCDMIQQNLTEKECSHAENHCIPD